MGEGRGSLVTVDDLNSLTQQNLTEQREKQQKGRERGLVGDLHLRTIVHLEAVGEVANALSLPPTVPISAGHDDHVMASLHQSLRHLILMQFHTT